MCPPHSPVTLATDDSFRMTTPTCDPAAGAEVGLLLVGHGSREPVGVDEFLTLARLTAARAEGWAVEPCFLEFARPTIVEGFERLAGRGARRIVVAPVMLFAAGHIRRDIPAAVAAVAAGYPDLPVNQAQHLGCHQAICQLSRARSEQAAFGKAKVAAEDTALVVVGRGSHDADATREMLDFVRLRQRLSSQAQVRTAFLAMADPPLAQVLDEVARTGARRIVVQPHLLFGGVLLERMRAIVERFAHEHPRTEWLVADHLGPADRVVDALLERAAAVLPMAARPCS